MGLLGNPEGVAGPPKGTDAWDSPLYTTMTLTLSHSNGREDESTGTSKQNNISSCCASVSLSTKS